MKEIIKEQKLCASYLFTLFIVHEIITQMVGNSQQVAKSSVGIHSFKLNSFSYSANKWHRFRKIYISLTLSDTSDSNMVR